MRLAVLVSLLPDSTLVEPNASAVHDTPGQRACAAYLESLGFATITIAERNDIEVRFVEALSGISHGDDVLVHISGHLDGSGAIAVGGPSEEGASFSVAALAAAAAAREPDGLVTIVEASYDGDPDDPLLAATAVDELRRTLDSATFGRSSLIAIRDGGGPDDPFAFTQLVLRIGDDLRQNTLRTVTLSQIVDELRTRPESPHVARSFSFSRGNADFEVHHGPLGAGAPKFEPLVELARFAMDHSKWDWAREAFYAALTASPDSAEARSHVFEGIGELEQLRGRPGAAKAAFLKARELWDSPAARDALLAFAHQESDWATVVTLGKEHARFTEDAATRADELFELARVAVEQIHDVPEAISLLEEANVADPSRPDVEKALERARRVLERRRTQVSVRDVSGVVTVDEVEHDIELDESDIILGERVRPKVPSRPPSPSKTDPDAMAHVAAISVEQSEPLASLLEAHSPETEIAALETALLGAPLDVEVLGPLFDVAVLLNQTDRAFLIADTLCELGAANGSVRAFAERHRPDGLRVRSPLTPSLFSELRPKAMDPLLDSLFAALGPSAIQLRHEERRAKGKVIRLDPQARTAPTSTASAVRCFHWAARILGVTCPALYVLEDVPGDIAAVPSEEPSTALGPGAVRGLSTKTLAFVAGRHLTYYRPEFSVLVHFPTLDDLLALVYSAYELGGHTRQIPPSHVISASNLARNLERNLSISDRAAVALCSERLAGRVDANALASWARNVELLASRVGLLIAGDLETAMNQVRKESRPIAGLTIEDRRHDLASYFSSREHAMTRAEIFKDATPSSPPGSFETGRTGAPPSVSLAAG